MFATRIIKAKVFPSILMIIMMCVATKTVGASVDETRNAALRYYQAMIRCPDLDEVPSEVVRRVFEGSGDARDARPYVNKYESVIEDVEAAAQMRRCDWGIPLLQAPSFQVATAVRARTIVFLLGADARILAEDGDHRAAFRRLFTLYRFAEHAASEPNLGSVVPHLIAGNAHRFMQQTLSITPPDRELLTWLRAELAADPFGPAWLPTVLHTDFQRALVAMHADETFLVRFRTIVPTNSSETFRAKQKALNDLDDGGLFDRIREPYACFLDDALEVLTGDMSYGQTCQTIDSMAEALEQKALDDPTVIHDWRVYAREMAGHYSTLVLHKTSLNALRVAVELYLAKAETGHLPQSLPDGLPNDLLSGQDFAYELTDTGFILRCRVIPDGYSTVPQFGFEVKASTEQIQDAR